ncbi:MAG: 4-hydroxy-tetrahydrodipicolinate synthase, partial [Rhodobacterales bacterium]|nr:4-hydroxy-tetrahydrodipicolinate synthase [Rhodobacterales bacterium]
MTFHGLMTALVTPFRDGALDEATFRKLVRRQIAGGIDGLVPCGTTGEAPTLPVHEHLQVVRWTVEEAAGRVPVMAGIGSNATASAIENAKRVVELGVQGVRATAPDYNKPTQEG